MPTATTPPDPRCRGVRALVALAALALALSLIVSPCRRTRDDTLPSDYRLVFEDDFDGTALDAAVWQTAPFGGSLPAVVADGVLTLRGQDGGDGPADAPGVHDAVPGPLRRLPAPAR